MLVGRTRIRAHSVSYLSFDFLAGELPSFLDPELVPVKSCCVIGCTSRYSKAETTGFFRFLRNDEKHRRWLAAFGRCNADSTSWIPGSGDRVCGRHFHSGRPHDSPAHPDYALSVAMGYESDEETDSESTRPANPSS